MRVAGVEGYVEVVGKGGGGPGGIYHSDVWVTILNTETGESVESESGIGHASVDGWGHPAPCDGHRSTQTSVTPPCRGRWTAIVRWLGPTAGVEVPLELNGWVRAFGDRSGMPAATLALETLTLSEVDEPRFDGAPAFTRATASGMLVVTPRTAPVAYKWQLRVPAADLVGPASYPRLGRLFAMPEVTEWTGPPSAADVTLTVGDVEAHGLSAIAEERDWLSQCQPSVDCTLPIELRFAYASSPEGATGATNGSSTIEWIVEARLEDYSNPSQTLAPIELTAVP